MRRQRQHVGVRVVGEHDRAQRHPQEVGARHTDAHGLEDVVSQQAVDARRSDAAGLIDFRVVGNDPEIEVVVVRVGQLKLPAKAVAARGPIQICVPNAGIAEGKSILMYAVIDNNPILAQVLIDAGANVNFRDANGDTALRLARRGGYYDLDLMLVQAGGRL